MAENAPELQKSLKSRHMTMISLGGVIGAGLFVGSSAVINTTGPAAVLSYLTYFAIAAMVVVIASMARVEDVRSQLIPSFISLVVVLVAYWFKTRGERSTATVSARGTA
jgi:L-asparagine transporter-like permease